MPEETKNCRCSCRCLCHRMIGVFAVLFGLAFLLGALDVVSQHVVSVAWPIVVILAGGTYMLSGMCKCCDQECCCTDKQPEK